MEEGSSQENRQTMPDLSLNNKEEEPRTQSELRSELTEDETLQEPTQVAPDKYIQEGSHKAFDDSPSMDNELLENLLDQ